MLKQLTILVLISGSLFGCTRLHHARTPHQAPSTNKMSIHQYKTPSAFTRVHINGDLDVTIHTNSIHPNVLFHGDPRDIAHVTWSVTNQELRIQCDKGYPKYGRVHADIASRYLQAFLYQGTGTIIGHYLHTNSFNLFLKNNGQTMLDGQIALHRGVFMGSGHTKIQGIQSNSMQLTLSDSAHAQLIGVANTTTVTMKGHSWLSLYWVKSHVLKIRLKEYVCAQIAGVSALLDAELWGNARFNGRYLRATRAFVKTHDRSEADIAVLYAQHTLASDASNIYYYDLPDMKADFMAEDGSVLDMREWERPFMKNSTRYNR